MTRPLIAYVRVSTSEQGRSGLRLEAQQEALSRLSPTAVFIGDCENTGVASKF
jgi:hypothetical protein